MALRNIVLLGNDILRQKSLEVEKIDDEIITLLNDMKQTLIKAEGAGLAAVQVGVLKRIFIINIEEGYFEFINPVITSKKGEQIDAEGCLSILNKVGDVKRPKYVTVKAYNRKGELFYLKAKDFFAKAICHEYDHLDGILYIDTAKNIRRAKK